MLTFFTPIYTKYSSVTFHTSTRTHATVHTISELRRAANNKAADELDAIAMASLGRPSVRPAGPTISGSPVPLHGTSPV